ncbi:N-methyl-L-tryptophan oxidase [Microlunatus sp. Gsoil 973]|uniref:N-methyl-L-tryptophan oxidase n=1 Tax=Microlunatus sp. Gsoil 973 TaxID=2672569 RepID=UPI0012B45493|nr:N-methyl-L-tryptophan oxidase [Microlunatus sp. Gsoil 973]QGN33395.1 N-methyl-L-tryptophan oxidase [Microlunatus sp. Gsoil 973]
MVSRSAGVIVIGLGSFGSATAAELAGRGLDVVGLETFGPAHDQGSGHGGSRIIRQSYFEGADYVPLLRSAYAGWRRLEERTGAQLLTLCGGLYIGSETSPIFAGACAAAQRWELPHEVLDADGIRARFPVLAPADDAMAVWEENAGYLRPEAAIRAHLDLATERGAELHFGERVMDWRATHDGVEVITEQQNYAADRLVITAGAWAPVLLRDLGLPLIVQRQVMYWLQPEFTAASGYRDYTDWRLPVYIEESASRDHQIYGFPMIDGPDGGLKIGIHHGSIIRESTADDLDRTVSDAEIAAVTERAQQLLPAIGARPVRAKVCMYTMTPDEDFVVGRHPDHDRVIIACGFSGHGFKFVPVIGEVLADLVQHGATGHPVGMFDPCRMLSSSDRDRTGWPLQSR